MASRVRSKARLGKTFARLFGDPELRRLSYEDCSALGFLIRQNGFRRISALNSRIPIVVREFRAASSLRAWGFEPFCGTIDDLLIWRCKQMAEDTGRPLTMAWPRPFVIDADVESDDVS